jgi:hypothetical protein
MGDYVFDKFDEVSFFGLKRY